MPFYDVELERERCLDIRSRRLVDKLGFDSREELDDLATEATRTTLNQVVSFADYVGVQHDILDELESDAPSLVLPGRDQCGSRYEITHGYGTKKTTQLKPSVQFLRQVLLVTQVAYDDTFGIIDAIDSTYIKKETIGYAYRYGIGLRLSEILHSTVAPNQKIFAKNNEERGMHSFAGYFGLRLAKPVPQITHFDPEHIEYETNFLARAPMVRGVIKTCQPGRSNEFNDVCTFGIERPMNNEEVNVVIHQVLPKKQKPSLKVIK